MKRFLITTADERTWRKDCPVLFLGNWCRLYSSRSSWGALDAEVLPYHWDDREKYYRDDLYLQTMYEDLLGRLVTALNAFHGTHRSLRYWRILIGPWLYLFTHALFDRWAMVLRAAETYEIEQTLILNHSAASLIPADLKGFDAVNIDWNHYIFGKIIKQQGVIPWVGMSVASKPEPTPVRPALRQSTIKSLLKGAYPALSSVLKLLTRRDEAFIISSYLPRLQEIKLQIALGQFPKLWRAPDLQAVAPDMSRRRTLQIVSDHLDPFHRFLCSMIPEQIPTVYLEGYRNLEQAVESLPWPSNPKVIFTSNLFQFCEVFQAWAAAKTESGTPFVIGQHGGFYGMAKWATGEDHQVKISDRFLTWGWQDERRAVYPAFALTIVNKPRHTWRADGGLLLVTVPIRIINFKSSSWPAGPNQSDSFVYEQLRFAGALHETTRDALTVRIDRRLDQQWMTCYSERWQSAFPTVALDYSERPIERKLRQCRLFVYTYNSTGFLETLARDIPTVIFWNPGYFELRESAEYYFKRLKRVGIYHETPESAAAHVHRVWDDVASWWNHPDVQAVRREFCEQYARMPEDPIRVMKDALDNVFSSRDASPQPVASADPLTAQLEDVPLVGNVHHQN